MIDPDVVINPVSPIELSALRGRRFRGRTS